MRKERNKVKANNSNPMIDAFLIEYGTELKAEDFAEVREEIAGSRLKVKDRYRAKEEAGKRRKRNEALKVKRKAKEWASPLQEGKDILFYNWKTFHREDGWHCMTTKYTERKVSVSVRKREASARVKLAEVR